MIEAAESNPDDATRRSGVVWKQDPAPGARGYRHGPIVGESVSGA